MSDEPKDTPPAKLRLSRDLKAKDEPEASKPPPAMKLKRPEPTEASPTKAPPSPAAVPPSDASAAPTDGGAAEKPGFDPKKPFGNAIKESEIKKNSPPPPELPSQPAPKIDDGSGAKLEESINSLSNGEAPPEPKSHLLTSLLVLCLLLLVLAGAGYGLWKVLLAPAGSVTSESAQVAETAESSPASAETPPKGPIQKARDAIAKVPVADVDGIVAKAPAGAAEAPPTQSPAQAAAKAPAEAAAEATPATGAANFTPEPPAASSAVEASKRSVAQYLSAVHIGGVRKGERPMILIEGESYLVGDVVQAETGLTFDGLRDGRLAFRDSHGIVYLKSF